MSRPLPDDVRDELRKSKKIELSIPADLYDDARTAMEATGVTMFTGWIRQAMTEKIVRDLPGSQTAMIAKAKAEYNRKARAKERAAARRKAKR